MSAETISLTEGTIIEEQKLSGKTVIRKKKISSDQLSVNIVGALAVGIFALICVIPFYLMRPCNIFRIYRRMCRNQHDNCYIRC